MLPNRIYIIGTVGSGKTFLANKLAHILKIKSYDLDNIFWKRKYGQKRSENERNRLFLSLCNKKKWIIEGVYTSWIKEGLKKSDMVILLDIPLSTLIWRITKRTIKREKSKKFGKNRYKESLMGYWGLLKAVIRYRQKSHERGYYKHKEMIAKHQVNFVCLKNKKEINDFLHTFSKNATI